MTQWIVAAVLGVVTFWVCFGDMVRKPYLTPSHEEGGTMHHPVPKERLVEVLELDLSETMVGQDAGVGTLQGLLYALAANAWIEEEGFDGKRPFGNSGWQHEVYELIAANGWCANSASADAGEPYPLDTNWVDNNLILPAMRLAFLRKVD